MQKTIHFALFLFLVTGMLFAGCEKTPEEGVDYDVSGSLEESLGVGTEDSGSTETDFGDYNGTLEGSENSNDSSSESSYQDGTYSENATYMSPAGKDTVGVSLTLKDGVITAVSIENLATNEGSILYQNLFAEGISAVVVGKPIDSLGSIGAVNGSSLTPVGFNAAVEAIMADAQA